MQRTRKIKPSAIFGVLLVAIVLIMSVGGMIAGGADRPEPLASVQLEEGADNRPAANNSLEQGARDIQDGALDAVDTGVEKAQNFDYENLKNEGAEAWEALKNGFDGNLGLEENATSNNDNSAVSADYNRAAFGEGWATGANGCSVRDNILDRDLQNVVKDGCVVVSGTLHGTYTGETIEHQRGSNGNASEVHIDHIVPLSYAWEHGANEWAPEQREAFANDATNLRAVSASANQSKSDSGLSDWMPAINQCDYAQTFVNITENYNLDIPAEDAAVVGQHC